MVKKHSIASTVNEEDTADLKAKADTIKEFLQKNFCVQNTIAPVPLF